MSNEDLENLIKDLTDIQDLIRSESYAKAENLLDSLTETLASWLE